MSTTTCCDLFHDVEQKNLRWTQFTYLHFHHNYDKNKKTFKVAYSYVTFFLNSAKA